MALALALLCAGCSTGSGQRDATDGEGLAPGGPPNIVLLLADDQRFDALGAVGGVAHTPELDRLAADGVRFANAFCTTSICPTSRATFLTGQWAARHGVVDFGTALTDSQFESSWPGVLRAAGYHGAFVGKWGLGGNLPRTRFDAFRGFAGQGRYFVDTGETRTVDRGGPPSYGGGDGHAHLTDRLATTAEELLGSPSLGEPFFLQLSFKAPHAQDGEEAPFQHAPRFAELFAGESFDRPASASEEAFAALPERLRLSEGRTRWRRRFATEEQRLESLHGYYRLVAGIDEAVGRLRSALERRGVGQRTVIVFSSDNGFLVGEHGLAGKWFPYEESIRIPLLVLDPRLPAERRGAVVEEMVLNADLAPTLIELAGAVVPASVQGLSLMPLLAGESPDWRREWYYEHTFDYATIPRSEALRTERWKFVRYVDEATVEQLFDLDSDPYELEDLAADERYGDRLGALRARLEELRDAAR